MLTMISVLCKHCGKHLIKAWNESSLNPDWMHVHAGTCDNPEPLTQSISSP